MVKRSKGRESGWTRCENHRVSRQIIDTVAAHDGVLHIEKLLGIRDRTKMTRKVNRMVHAWPFAQFFAFIRYKTALAGVQVVEEDPRHEPAVQQVQAHRARDPVQTGPFSLHGMRLLCTCRPQCGT